MSIEEFFSHELNDWDKTIDFYLADLDMLKERLQEVATKNTKAVVLENVEHFQNQFIVQKESLQAINHKIQVQKDNLGAEIKNIAGLNDLGIVDTQHFLRESVHLAEKIFLEVKHSFYRFLSRVL
jgi:hypothetical protein